VPQANSKHGYGRIQDRIAGDAEIALAVGPPRSWGNDYAVKVKSTNLRPVHLVVADDDGHLPCDLRNRVDKVEGKRIVVIDD